MIGNLFGISCVSASALLLEVSLSRLLSIAHGQELSYMVISLALLGYGMATPFLCRLKFLSHVSSGFWAIGFSITILGVLYISHFIFLDSGRLAWEGREWFRVGILYFLWSLPFLFSGLTIASLFMKMIEKSYKLYAGDLAGAGVGAILPFFFLPSNAALFSASFAAAGGFFLSKQKEGKLFAVILLAATLMIGLNKPAWELPMSPSRGLPTALLDPEARLTKTYWSPWTRVDLFWGTASRVAPGLSLNYLGSFPKSLAGFSVDGDKILPMTSIHRSEDDYLNYLPQAIPYQRDGERASSVLLIQQEGGIELAEALFHSIPRIDIVMSDSLFEKIHPSIGSIFWYAEPTRFFLKKNARLYDLMVIGNLGASGAVSSGFGAIHQNFHLTEEFFDLVFEHLEKDGIAAIHLYRLPPLRLELRLFQTLLESLEKRGIKKFGEHIAIIQSLQTTTFLISKARTQWEKKPQFDAFIKSRGYDLLFPGKSLSSESLLYHRSVQNRGQLGNYPFFTEKITDDRPFPNQSIRLSMLLEAIHRAKGHWQLILEGGGFSWLVLLQAILGAFLILLISWSKHLRDARKKNKGFDFYFLFIGFGFIFLEIGWMQRLSLLLTHPAQAVPLVLGSMLIGAGVGSHLASIVFIKRKNLMFLSLGVASLLCFFSAEFLPCFVEVLTGTSWASIILIFLLIANSIALGIPFPTGLSFLEKNSLRIPWVWGLNACASVVGAALVATLVPMVGFRFIFVLAMFCYLLAAIFALGLFRSSEQNSRRSEPLN